MSSERRKPYPFDEFEPKWQRIWDEQQLFQAPNPGDKNFDPAKPKFYVLDMFPYPSGAGLHVGHPEGYTATDIIARYKRIRGFNVLHPMGWDAFGLPAEQYAIKTGQHPAITTRENISKFKTQLKRIGFSYDWSRELSTADPKFYRWTQWIFLQIYNSWFNPQSNKAEPISTYDGDDPDSVRLAYVAEVPVNWCPDLGTVLANEEVIDGKSEVGGFPVVRRPMRQWMLRITAFAQRLIDELDGLNWPEGIKLLQRNWIGRSEGAEIEFAVAAVAGRGAQTALHSAAARIPVFTTRHDTIYGATYLVLAPEHPLVDQIVTSDKTSAIEKYRAEIAAKSDLERTDLAKEKTGVFTGAFALHTVTGERIPIWIADYVLLSYGTGAIMGVPAHDERDLEFAQRYGLPIKEVVTPVSGRVGVPPAGAGILPERTFSVGAATRKVREGETPLPASETSTLPGTKTAFTGEGIAVDSPLIDGLQTAEAKNKIVAWLEENRSGRSAIRFKLRDWLFSRQRYWGEPFPIVWENGRHRSLNENELPLVPPKLEDFISTGTGEAPLAKAREWIRYSETAIRETNTMPQWAGSCWYYLRFCDPKNDTRFVGEEAERYWMGEKKSEIRNPRFETMSNDEREDASRNSVSDFELRVSSFPAQPGGVDLYVGGTEHAVLHLLYARFWHKVLFDLGYVGTPEPFQRLVNQGIILGEDNRKMSKRWGNVIDPLDVIAEYGADAFRCYEMFMGPLEQMKPWSMRGVEGVSRFLARVWRLMMNENQAGEWIVSLRLVENAPSKNEARVLHATIKKVTEDIESLSFNTAISAMMVFVNAFTNSDKIPVPAMRPFLILLDPFAPHLASELWERLREKFPGGEITSETWPQFDETLLRQTETEIIVQINGKVRDKVSMPTGASDEELRVAAQSLPKIEGLLTGKTVRKIVVVPDKLVNFVVN